MTTMQDLKEKHAEMRKEFAAYQLPLVQEAAALVSAPEVVEILSRLRDISAELEDGQTRQMLNGAITVLTNIPAHLAQGEAALRSTLAPTPQPMPMPMMQDAP
jgi:hypothetical protein